MSCGEKYSSGAVVVVARSSAHPGIAELSRLSPACRRVRGDGSKDIPTPPSKARPCVLGLYVVYEPCPLHAKTAGIAAIVPRYRGRDDPRTTTTKCLKMVPLPAGHSGGPARRRSPTTAAGGDDFDGGYAGGPKGRGRGTPAGPRHDSHPRQLCPGEYERRGGRGQRPARMITGSGIRARAGRTTTRPAIDTAASTPAASTRWLQVGGYGQDSGTREASGRSGGRKARREGDKAERR